MGGPEGRHPQGETEPGGRPRGERSLWGTASLGRGRVMDWALSATGSEDRVALKLGITVGEQMSPQGIALRGPEEKGAAPWCGTWGYLLGPRPGESRDS